MGGLTLRGTNLNGLLCRARALTSDAAVLSDIFAQEADVLNRKRMVSQLVELRYKVSRELQATKDLEDTARYNCNRADIEISATRLAIGAVIKLALPSSPTLSVVGDQLLKTPAKSERLFGRVSICIDSRGVPDGVEVVNVSRLARELNRGESDVRNELRERGYRLFSESEFSLLIDNLIGEVEGDRLYLPIFLEKLPQIEYKVVIPDGRQKSGIITPSVIFLKKEGGESSEIACKNPHAALYGGA